MLNLSTAALDRAASEADRLMRQGLPVEAGEACKRILQICPTHLGALRGLAAAAVSVGNYPGAVEVWHAAIRLEPNHVPTLRSLAEALVLLNRTEEAAQWAQRAAALAPRDAGARLAMGLARMAAARAGEALVCFREAQALAPADYRAASSPLYAMHYVEDLTPQEVASAHRQWGAAYPRGASKHANSPEPERRLRIGYVSPDFRNHAVARFIEPLLRHHDPQQVEVFCYYNFHVADAVTARLRPLAAHWRDISRLPDAEVAALMRRDGIDVLVDLAGHTADGRLTVFALRPAPVQVTYLGYPATTGLPAMDYRLTDAIADPPGAEALCTERLLRLPPPFVCFQMPSDLPPVSDAPAPLAGHITFGSFNSLVKLAPSHLGTWARLLCAVPGSRLFLKAAALGDSSVRERVEADFESRGVARNRLLIAGHTPDGRTHLAQYQHVDIALDTFPYNGTTTTCEALAMAVPVVTRAGNRHASRVGASLLTAVGHPEWVAADEDAYIAIAAALANDPQRRAELRRTLRAELAGSPLTDGRTFAANIERAYRAIWQTWCSSVKRGEHA